MFLTLPTEIQFDILSFVDAHDLGSILLACSDLYHSAQYFIDAKTTIVSAVINFCKHERLSIVFPQNFIKTNPHSIKDKTYLFCHYDYSTKPLIIDVTNKTELQIVSHCQLKYYKDEQKLALKYHSTLGFFKHTHSLKTHEKTVKTLDTVPLKPEFLNVQLNCFKPKGHKFRYHLSGTKSYTYFYIISPSLKRLTIKPTSYRDLVRILHVNQIDKFLIKIIFLAGDCVEESFLNFFTEKVIYQKSFPVGVIKLRNRCLLIDNFLIDDEHRFVLSQKDVKNMMQLSFE